MKINATKFYTTIFVIVLFIQLYLPSFRVNIYLQLLVLGVFFFLERKSFSVSLLNYILPVILLLLIGFTGTTIHKYVLVNILKDIFHFLKPLAGILIGYFFYKKIDNFPVFVKTIVLVGFASAITHFLILVLFSKTANLSDVREFGKDNFLELFALFFLGYYRKFQNQPLFSKKWQHYVVFTVILLSAILYFSRTMIVVAMILFISIYKLTVINTKTIKVFGVLLLLVFGFYAYLFSIKLDRNSKGIEAFFYKIQIAPSELLKTKIDRENHKDLWDHWRGYEAKRAFALMERNPSSFIFGNGHGSLVDLKFYAPLTGDSKGMRYISELHNGYAYLLYKTGIIGLFIYLYFLIVTYLKIYKKQDMIYIFISAIGLIFLFTTITITGIYNGKDIIVFILGALFAFKESKTFYLKTAAV